MMDKRPDVLKHIDIKRASEVFAEKRGKDGVIPKSYEAYKEFIDRAFAERIESQLRAPAFLLEEHIGHYLNELKKNAPVEREWKLIYQFTTLFCTFLHTLQVVQLPDQTPQLTRIFYGMAMNLIEELSELILQLSRQARPFAFDPFIKSLQTDVRTLLDDELPLEYERIDLYRDIWTFLFSKSASRKEELERMLEQRDIMDRDTDAWTTYTVAAIHLAVLEHQDDQVKVWLSELDTDAIPYLFYWLNLVTDKRALPLIEFVIAHIGSFLPVLDSYYECVDFVRTFTKPIYRWCDQEKRIDLLDKFYRATLPHSYWNYANFLFEQKQYKKWVEMHIYSNISIDMINTELIKEVVATEPRLMLPLYYHAVQEKVSLKNRSAYKQAVRYLKKMRTIYKKIKQEETFERYLVYVVDSTKRLRAFQEELKRSKLIDV